MSTNGNLPAGQFTTKINGKQCTAVPRSDVQQSSTAPAAPVAPPPAAKTTAPSPPPETTTPIVQSEPPPDTPTTFSTSSTPVAAVPVVEESTPQVISTTPVVTPTPLPIVADTSTSEAPQRSTSVQSATPASKLTTPTISSQTSVPIAQSEIHTSATPSLVSTNRFPETVTSEPTPTPSTSIVTAPNQEESSATPGSSSKSKMQVGPIVGGIIGSIALLLLVGVILWFCRRRRRRRRDSLLTPLTIGNEKTFYEIDNSSVGPTRRSQKWKAEVDYQGGKVSAMAAGLKSTLTGVGASLKSKVVGERSDTPSVNLNRGNSQFMEPIPQHSRNNSVLSNTATLTARDRFNDWWDRFTGTMSFNWLSRRRQSKEPADPFAAARSMSEKQARTRINSDPDFSKLLGIDDREMQLQAEQRRTTLTNSIPNLGSLGLNFESSDPFVDPVLAAPSKTQNKAWVPPNPSWATKTNPFSDPITQPERSIPKSQTYIPEIRRSRGSLDATKTSSTYTANDRPPSAAVASRYPSSIAPSRDSYRDTVFSSFSANGRKGKGRSDPFDLERPELWRPIIPPVMPDNNRTSVRPRGGSMGMDRNSMIPGPLHPNPLRMSSIRGTPVGPTDSNGAQPRVVSVATPRVISTATFESKYSSGVSSLGDWGDPGPDLGPGNSSTSSLRGNASSNGSLFAFSAADAKGIYGEGVIKGSLAEISSTGNVNEWDGRRATDNVSPVSVESKASSKGGVGKAM